MRDSLKDPANDPASGGSRSFEPTLLEGPDSRELIQKSVLYLSALLTFDGLIHIINRSEPHFSMWFSLGVTVIVLIVVCRVPTSPHHLVPSLHKPHGHYGPQSLRTSRARRFILTALDSALLSNLDHVFTNGSRCRSRRGC